jgi:co-chaperonin GroES (HSP10)
VENERIIDLVLAISRQERETQTDSGVNLDEQASSKFRETELV